MNVADSSETLITTSMTAGRQIPGESNLAYYIGKCPFSNPKIATGSHGRDAEIK
jgi:hypothetical protein